MPEHSAEFLRGAYKIATRYAPMDVAMQINADLFEAEAHETTHPTAADVIAEAKKALECFPLGLIAAVTFDDSIPTRIKVSADSMRLLLTAQQAIAAWEAAQR